MSDWFDGGGNGSPVDVLAMLDAKAANALWEMVQEGALVSLGTTSDGGALGITVTVNGKWRREYVRDADQLSLFAEEAVGPVTSAARQFRASPVQGKRSRGLRGL